MAEKLNGDAEQALLLMRKAIELLDQSRLAPDAAAHLDLAIHRLTEALWGDDSPE